MLRAVKEELGSVLPSTAEVFHFAELENCFKLSDVLQFAPQIQTLHETYSQKGGVVKSQSSPGLKTKVRIVQLVPNC